MALAGGVLLKYFTVDVGFCNGLLYNEENITYRIIVVS